MEESQASTIYEHPLWLSRPEYVNGLATYMKQSAGRLQFVFNWIIGETRIAPLWQRKLAVTSSSPVSNSSQSQKGSFPVVIFSHGLSGCRHFYSTYCASLASNGFVVAAIEHSDYSACWTYKLIPDSISGRLKERYFPIRIVDKDDKRMFKIRNQQLNKRVSECVKALHVLEEIALGQLQSDNIAIGKEFDWSMFKAAAVLDGWLYPLESGHYERATQPTLFLNAGKWQYLENIERMHKLRNIAEKPMFTFRDAEHQTFTDFAFLVNSYIGRRMKLHGETAPEVAMDAIVQMTVAFFNKEQNQESRDLRHLVNEKYSHFVVDGCPSHLMNGKPG
ncbi:Platelet-activating factor acetylhydrolase, plasma/intracellular isoform II [Teladorsagia circumcincta]|uniref:1-alkyl-2-acetylglycerophosphocholine esterase n=1 Tax=Teladorsagia circumcincta TaxID=45464 RepID=A0A2G9UKQ1_TELCI|nr:Platelet-activating factor acetylhydrolase, plasma/intracellular isoform II [Teladorsagia circumcincta]